MVEAADGGLLVEADDAVLWTIERGELLSRKAMESSFDAVTSDEMAERMLAELPAGFRIHTTPHYVVCYNTSREYAQWTSSLLERLYKAFTSYWENAGPRASRTRVSAACRSSSPIANIYDAASREDLPGGTGNIVGFYSLRSNRVNMFDLTGAEAVRDARTRSADAPRLDARDQPDALATGGRAARGHDRSRSDAPNRLQLRPANALRRYPALALRRHGRLLRSARPLQHARLARHRQSELSRASRPFTTICRTGTMTRSSA